MLFKSLFDRVFIRHNHTPYFVKTVVGYEQFGLITIRWFWNLYEAADGTRSFSKFHGGAVKATRSTDYSAPAQVDCWLHGGPLKTKHCPKSCKSLRARQSATPAQMRKSLKAKPIRQSGHAAL